MSIEIKNEDLIKAKEHYNSKTKAYKRLVFETLKDSIIENYKLNPNNKYIKELLEKNGFKFKPQEFSNQISSFKRKYKLNSPTKSNQIAKENKAKGKHHANEIEQKAKEISTKELKPLTKKEQTAEFNILAESSFYKDYGRHTSDKRYFSLSKVENEIVITQIDDKKEYKVHIPKGVWNLIVNDIKGELEEECDNREEIKNSIERYPTLSELTSLNSPIYLHKIIGQALMVLFWGLERSEWHPKRVKNNGQEKHEDQIRCIKRACLIWRNLPALQKQEFYYWCDTNQADQAFVNIGVRAAIRCFLFFHKDPIQIKTKTEAII